MVFVRKFAVEIGLALVLVAALAFGWQRSAVQNAAPSATVATKPQAAVAVAPLAPAPSIAHDTILPGATQASLDAVIVGDQILCCSAASKSVVDVKRSDTIVLRGWAVDAGAHRAASAVLGSIGASPPIEFTYGGKRPDVAAAFHNPDYEPVAFEGHIAPNTLRPGLNAIVLDVVGGSQKAYYRTPTRFTLDVH